MSQPEWPSTPSPSRVSHPATKSGRRDPGLAGAVRRLREDWAAAGRALSGSPGTGNSASGRARSLRALDAQPRRPSDLVWPRQRPLLGLRLGVHLGSPGAGLQGKALIKAERSPRFHSRPSEARSPDPPKNRRLFSVESQKSALGFSVCPREGERVGGARPAGILQEHPDLSPRPRNMCLLEGPGRLLVFLISETGDWTLALLSVNSLARKWYWPTDLEFGTNSRSPEPHQKVTSIPSAWGRGRK